MSDPDSTEPLGIIQWGDFDTDLTAHAGLTLYKLIMDIVVTYELGFATHKVEYVGGSFLHLEAISYRKLAPNGLFKRAKRSEGKRRRPPSPILMVEVNLSGNLENLRYKAIAFFKSRPTIHALIALVVKEEPQWSDRGLKLDPDHPIKTYADGSFRGDEFGPIEVDDPSLRFALVNEIKEAYVEVWKPKYDENGAVCGAKACEGRKVSFGDLDRTS